MDGAKGSLRFILPVLNALAWCAFLLLRPSVPTPELRLRDLKEAQERLEPGVSIEMSSGAPYGLLACRTLYNWSEWHGGESPWVKALMVVNLPALIATAIPALVFGLLARGVVPIAVRSWLYFVLFLGFSSFMWFGVGVMLRSAWSRHLRRALGKGRSGAA